jgi:hypothetical protein
MILQEAWQRRIAAWTPASLKSNAYGVRICHMPHATCYGVCSLSGTGPRDFESLEVSMPGAGRLTPWPVFSSYAAPLHMFL